MSEFNLQVFKARNPRIDFTKKREVLMVACSMQSDAQESIANGDLEQARKLLNLSKGLIFEVMDQIEKVEGR